MTAKICPKCGCVYGDGRSECTDCGEFTRKATDEELAVFERSNEKKLKHAIGTHPHKWQIVAAVLLVVFPSIMFWLYSIAKLRPIEPLAITVVNVSLAFHLLVPSIDSVQMLVEFIARRRTKLRFSYNYHKLFLHLIWVIAFDLLTLAVSLFRPDGLIINLLSRS